jgi:hypothetical protein
MPLGFIIIRHVNSKQSDYYWKECYTCIRKFYDNPILIIDDNSDKSFLNENIYLQNCTIIFDKLFPGRGELLPYYYFHLLRPFETAVVIHDSVFIQNKINFELYKNENVRFLWSFSHKWDDELFPTIEKILSETPSMSELIKLFWDKNNWMGCFGSMSIIRWDFLNQLQTRHKIFDVLLKNINNRNDRHALERAFGLICCLNDPNINNFFGDIHNFIKWGTKFSEYLTDNFSNYPLVKVWSGR